ncbi:hypothetical protein [Microbacterium panaciterrae]|uniref:Uncharacterized protein n=1 Tax=Microbacterium panaciterrae TaxID=985759 RepID=A0ABP8PS61_9MICO
MTNDTNATDVFADHEVVKKLGRWTTEREFTIRARRSTVVLDLRSPEIEEGEVVVNIDVDKTTLELLVADDAEVDQRQIAWTGRGRVKDATGGTGGRRIILVGSSAGSEVRVKRGGVAILTTMATREFIEDAKNAHRTGVNTTVDDPTRNPNGN